MFGKILVSIIFLCAISMFYLARKTADKFFGGKDGAFVTLKVVSAVVIIACVVLAVYI